jgi:UDP-GlcNAc:undecaprenyl-phosphate GlcNAc-1-phosphate transferase
MIFYFFLIFVLSIFFILLIRKYAKVWGLIDVPNERSMHNKAIAKGAGIAFYMAILLSLVLFHLDFLLAYLWLFMAISLIFILGLLDDFYNLSPKIKFTFLLLSTILLSFNEIIIQDIGIFFTFSITLSWLALPFTIFVIAGFTNAMNLIDGLDGLATMIGLVIFLCFVWIGYAYHDAFILFLSLSFLSTLLAFLIFNWSPASIFMGDSGSLLLGFVLSILSIHALRYIPAISILFIGAVPIIDTLIVMFRRKRRGSALCEGDACHIHHLLEHYFDGDIFKSVLLLVLIQILYISIGINLEKGIDQGWILVGFIFHLLVIYKILNTLIKKENINC